MNHTVVISDVHLCEVEPGSGLWMRYRQKPWLPDGELAAMLAAVRDAVRGDELTVVLGGDVFDFDAPRVVAGESLFHDLPRTAEHAVPALAAILDDHPLVVEALARVLVEGHSIVVVSGNHDVELTLPEVRTLLRARLVEAALGRLDERPRSRQRAEIARRVVFRAWFHRTADGIVIEHGHQYDPYCSYHFPMAPFTRKTHRRLRAAAREVLGLHPNRPPVAREIQPTMGSLATRLLVSRLGYFNPHVDTSFMLSFTGYVAHWARYYLVSRHSLALTWVVGCARILFELVRRRSPGTREQRRGDLGAAALETGATPLAIARHARLFAAPAEDKLDLVARELWLDRVGLAAGCAALAAAWIALSRGYWAFASVLPMLLFPVYRRFVPKDPLEMAWRAVGRVARRIGQIHRAKAVVFGHTHHADGSWEGGVFHGNSGCWSAAYRDIACTQPVSDERPVVWLTSDARGELWGGLMAWRGAHFEPRIVRERPAEPEIMPKRPARTKSEARYFA